MKTLLKIFFKTLLFTLLGWSVAFAQTIRIADNNVNRPTGANIYPTLQAAINAAVANDIVYITPSTASYGNVTVGKKIILQGVGFNIPELGTRSSTVGVVTVQNSANGTDNISGAIFRGFIFTQIFFGSGTGPSTLDNIIIENVIGGGIYHSYSSALPGTDNLVIRDSYVTLIQMGLNSGMTNTKIYRNIFDNAGCDLRNNANALISNNLFLASTTPLFYCPGNTNMRIEHNIFSGSGTMFQEVYNAMIVNNIFYGKTPDRTTGTFSDNTFSNNLILSTYTMPPPATGGSGANSGTGNITGTGPQFTNAPVVTTWGAAAANNYTITAGPCINGATTGDNIGPSGGLYPWTNTSILSLKPSSVPVITLFGNSGVVPQNQPLKSNIKAKSN